MIKNSIFFGLLCSLLFLAPFAHAHKAHEHGRAQMNIAVDGAQVAIYLESPLDNVVG